MRVPPDITAVIQRLSVDGKIGRRTDPPAPTNTEAGYNHHHAQPGEVPLKEWAQQEAERCGVRRSAIFMRLSRGRYPHIQLRRVNQRVIFVTVTGVRPSPAAPPH